jgi:ectoine hydroxylase-related dioxygenase (phytanoyl-CoA dioxygenase family)
MTKIINSKDFFKNPKKSVSFYNQNGYLIIKKIFTKLDYKFLLDTISYNASKFLKKKNKKSNNYNQTLSIINKELTKLREKERSHFSNLYDSLQHTAALYKLTSSSKVLNIVEKILNTKKEILGATAIQLRLDSPIDSRNKLTWHQDSAFFRQNNNGNNAMSIWMPLQKTSFDTGPLEFLEKSHKLGSLKFKHKNVKKFETVQKEVSDKIIKKFDLKQFEIDVGDAIFLNFDTIHRSGLNKSNIFRIVAICRYHKMLLNDFNAGLNIFKYNKGYLNKLVKNGF